MLNFMLLDAAEDGRADTLKPGETTAGRLLGRW